MLGIQVAGRLQLRHREVGVLLLVGRGQVQLLRRDDGRVLVAAVAAAKMRVQVAQRLRRIKGQRRRHGRSERAAIRLMAAVLLLLLLLMLLMLALHRGDHGARQCRLLVLPGGRGGRGKR